MPVLMRRGLPAAARVGLLTGVLGAVAVTVVLVERAPLVRAPLPVPWWLIALAYLVTEVCLVRLRVHGAVRRVSFSEAPLVIGLLLADPVSLVLGAVAGTAAAQARLARHDLPRAAWVTALTGAKTSVAAIAFGVLWAAYDVPPAALQDNRLEHVWMAVLSSTITAASAAGLFEAATALLVGSWYGRRPTWGAVLVDLTAAAAVPATIGALGVVAVLVAEGAAMALPLAGLGVAILLGYAAFEALSQRHAALERLYHLSDVLTHAGAPDEVIRSVLHQSMLLLDAGYAEFVLDGLHGNVITAWTARTTAPQGAGPAAVTDDGPRDALPLLDVQTAGLTQPRHLRRSATEDRSLLQRRGIGAAVVVPVRVGEEIQGHLLVGDHPSSPRSFDDVDARLLVTIANHAGVALVNARLIDRLHIEARQDELTGLPNRMFFRELLQTTVDHSSGGFAVMLLDFDGFKAINDTLGHSAGDDLLREVARRLAEVAGDDATVARLGGDEFAVVSTAAPDERRARRLAARLLSVFDEPVPVAGTRLRLGGSLGIALSPQHATSSTDLMRNADVAMYAAKRGAGGAQLFAPEMLADDAITLTLGGDIRDAVAHDDIDVVVHPVVALATGGVHSVEVLARWHHPTLGEISPGVFFRAAEQAGLVAELSARILDRALRLCRGWLDDGHAVRVAVNTAPRWLADPTLPEQVSAALERHGVPADLLSLELTERSVIADPRRVTVTLERLRELGVHLSVDDFGTGYSSLTYLSSMPVDQLKIDETFVARVLDSPRDRAIVRSIVDLARNLELEVVAEGVGDPVTRAMLVELGCTLAQGYLFGRPFDPAHLPAFSAAATDRLAAATLPVQRSRARGSAAATGPLG